MIASFFLMATEALLSGEDEIDSFRVPDENSAGVNVVGSDSPLFSDSSFAGDSYELVDRCVLTSVVLFFFSSFLINGCCLALHAAVIFI